jgi:hypothetical protein
VPDNFRLFFDYLPAARLHWKKLRFRVGRRWVEEWRIPRHWGLDQTSAKTWREADSVDRGHWFRLASGL